MAKAILKEVPKSTRFERLMEEELAPLRQAESLASILLCSDLLDDDERLQDCVRIIREQIGAGIEATRKAIDGAGVAP